MKVKALLGNPTPNVLKLQKSLFNDSEEYRHIIKEGDTLSLDINNYCIYIPELGRYIQLEKSNFYIKEEKLYLYTIDTFILNTEIIKFNPFIHYLILTSNGIEIVEDQPDKKDYPTCYEGLIYCGSSKVPITEIMHNEYWKFWSCIRSKISTTHKSNSSNPLFRQVKLAAESFKPPKYIEDSKALDTLLSPITFGFEYEVAKGKIPFSAYKLGVGHVIDGSLPSTGAEYCTIPLSGMDGVNRLYKICKHLSEYCTVSTACSLHLNIGNIKSDEPKSFIVALYILYQRLQEELLCIFPFYVRNPVATVGKQKMYADALIKIPSLPRKQLEDINYISEYIEFTYTLIKDLYVGDKIESDTLLNEENPWALSTRYSALNLVPFFTSDRNKKRIEFRIHPPTTNFDKSLAWLIICISIVQYTTNNYNHIIASEALGVKITLNTVLDSIVNLHNTHTGVYPSDLEIISESIKKYIEEYATLRLIEFHSASTKSNANQGGLSYRNRLLNEMCVEEFKADPKFKSNAIRNIYKIINND